MKRYFILAFFLSLCLSIPGCTGATVTTTNKTTMPATTKSTTVASTIATTALTVTDTAAIKAAPIGTTVSALLKFEGLLACG